MKESRLARFAISRRALHNKLPIIFPPNSTIEYISYEVVSDSFWFTFYNKNLGIVQEGDIIPQIIPELHEIDYNWLKNLIAICIENNIVIRKEIRKASTLMEERKFEVVWPKFLSLEFNDDN